MEFEPVYFGGYNWIILKEMADKYFLLSEAPLFTGYYSIEMSDFPGSKLYAFLNSKFKDQLQAGNVDINKINGIGVLTLGQYNLYVKNKLPEVSLPYLLQTPADGEENSVLSVNPDGSIAPIKITTPCSIRPCLFVSKEYLEESTTIYSVQHENLSDELTKPADHEVLPVSSNQSDKQAEEQPSAANNQKEIVVIPTAEISDSKKPLCQEDGASECSELNNEERTVGTGTVISHEAECTQSSDGEEQHEEPEPDGDTDISEAASDILKPEEETDITEAVPMVETPIGCVDTDNGEVFVTEVADSKAVYLFTEEDYVKYGVLFKGGEDELRQTMAMYGLTIKAFMANSINENRKPYSKTDILSSIKQRQKKWNWRG